MPTGCLRALRWGVILIALGLTLYMAAVEQDLLQATFFALVAYMFWKAPVGD